VPKSVVMCIWVKCSESLCNRMSNIIRGYIRVDHMKFAAFMAFSSIIFFHVLLVLFIILCMVVCFVYFC